MKNFILNECGVSEVSQREMVSINGGNPIWWMFGGYVLGKAIDLLIDCAVETYHRGTLVDCPQNNPKLWN